MADYKTIRSTAGSRSEVIDSGLRAHMNKVYGTMSVGMLITALAAWAISGLATTTTYVPGAVQIPNGTFLTSLGEALYLSPLKWIVMLAPLGILFFGFGHVMRKSSAAAAQLLFFIFASTIMGKQHSVPSAATQDIRPASGTTLEDMQLTTRCLRSKRRML